MSRFLLVCFVVSLFFPVVAPAQTVRELLLVILSADQSLLGERKEQYESVAKEIVNDSPYWKVVQIPSTNDTAIALKLDFNEKSTPFALVASYVMLLPNPIGSDEEKIIEVVLADHVFRYENGDKLAALVEVIATEQAKSALEKYARMAGFDYFVRLSEWNNRVEGN